jgi:hypothetical protein
MSEWMDMRGPWRAVRNNAYWQVDNADDQQVADACSAKFTEHGEVYERAVAHLIAAAPDLLAAAEAVSEARAEYMAHAYSYGSESEEANVAENALEFALDDLNAAIAKAKGEADD